MGRWHYYSVKMNMREVAESVQFAHDVYEDRTLDDAIQRVLNTGRVRKQIVTYLQRQQDRFFASIVVAALGGNPKWFPVLIEDDPRFAVLAADERLNNSFGVLAFDGSQQYYALDGQHRLAAIKALMDPNDEASFDAPKDFRNEEISVLVVVPQDLEDAEEFLKRYRRLFGNLNRYAKPMDQVTNIIMDEDDAFALITRRLLSTHEFFKAAGKQKESPRVKTTKGKNLRSTDAYFTSLEALYSMNIALLHSRYRRQHGWGSGDASEEFAEFMRFRPDDDYIDRLSDELTMYWNALLEELPVLREEPETMRTHDISGGEEATDSLLFWPIGQELLADVAREMLDQRIQDPNNVTYDQVREAFRGLGQLEWRLHEVPWRYYLLTQDPNGSWKMRSEDRRAALDWARLLILWLLGLDELDAEGVAGLKNQWSSRLIPSQTSDVVDEMWEQILDQRRALSAVTY
jgi:DGQHR domain-containing protein